LPVILATGTFPHEELAEQPWLQIDASLLKPYSLDQLLTTVKNVLYANTTEAEEFAAPPNWLGESLPNRLRF
jgi:DNA-binding NtrC family response regulator